MKINNLCLCFSGKPYSDCCQKYHQGVRAENALALMRSRYCAYALELPLYIIQTTHPSNEQYQSSTEQWCKEISNFCRTTIFTGLKILDFQVTGEDTATVTFIAYLKQGGKEASFEEKSCFERSNGRWLYKNKHSWNLI